MVKSFHREMILYNGDPVYMSYHVDVVHLWVVGILLVRQKLPNRPSKGGFKVNSNFSRFQRRQIKTEIHPNSIIEQKK